MTFAEDLALELRQFPGQRNLLIRDLASKARQFLLGFDDIGISLPRGVFEGLSGRGARRAKREDDEEKEGDAFL
ncbi:MAG: hypothetical protein ACREIA_13585 [Opitutaceae bacterium]